MRFYRDFVFTLSLFVFISLTVSTVAAQTEPAQKSSPEGKNKETTTQKTKPTKKKTEKEEPPPPPPSDPIAPFIGSWKMTGCNQSDCKLTGRIITIRPDYTFTYSEAGIALGKAHLRTWETANSS